MEAIPFDQTQRDVQELKQEFKQGFRELKRLILNQANPNDLPQPELPINIKEVSSLTGKTVPTIYGYVHRNEIPHAKKGNRLYFFKSEIIDWIKSGKRRTDKELGLEVEGYLESKK